MRDSMGGRGLEGARRTRRGRGGRRGHGGRSVALLHLEVHLEHRARGDLVPLREGLVAALVDDDLVGPLRQPEIGRIAVEVASLADELAVHPHLGLAWLDLEVEGPPAHETGEVEVEAARGRDGTEVAVGSGGKSVEVGGAVEGRVEAEAVEARGAEAD